MKVLIVYVWRFWMLIVGSIFTLVFFVPVFLLSIRKRDYKHCYFFIRLWAMGIFYSTGFSYRIINITKKKINKNQAYVIISNHTSLMDVMIPCILFPNHPLCYVGKKELERIPIFGIVYRRVCVLVDRKSAKSRGDVYRRCAERMKEGQSVVIYPEGGVPEDPNVILDQFKDGAFTLASKHQFPIAVYTIVGLKEMFPFDNKKGYPGCVDIYFNDIIMPNQPLKELKRIAYDEMKLPLQNHFN